MPSHRPTLPRRSPEAGHAPRRRRRMAGILGVPLLAVLSLGAVAAVAQELDADPTASAAPPGTAAASADRNPDFAAGRLDSFGRQAGELEQERVAWLTEELRDFVATMTIEGITAERRAVWGRLADCESGDWYGGVPAEGTRRWNYGLAFDHGDFFQGGLNFHPRTWDAFRDADMPGHAGEATEIEQMVVAERVLAAQGWGAWPVCSRKMGLR